MNRLAHSPILLTERLPCFLSSGRWDAICPLPRLDVLPARLAPFQHPFGTHLTTVQQPFDSRSAPVDCQERMESTRAATTALLSKCLPPEQVRGQRHANAPEREQPKEHDHGHLQYKRIPLSAGERAEGEQASPSDAPLPEGGGGEPSLELSHSGRSGRVGSHREPWGASASPGNAGGAESGGRGGPAAASSPADASEAPADALRALQGRVPGPASGPGTGSPPGSSIWPVAGSRSRSPGPGLGTESSQCPAEGSLGEGHREWPGARASRLAPEAEGRTGVSQASGHVAEVGAAANEVPQEGEGKGGGVGGEVGGGAGALLRGTPKRGGGGGAGAGACSKGEGDVGAALVGALVNVQTAIRSVGTMAALALAHARESVAPFTPHCPGDGGAHVELHPLPHASTTPLAAVQSAEWVDAEAAVRRSLESARHGLLSLLDLWQDCSDGRIAGGTSWGGLKLTGWQGADASGVPGLESANPQGADAMGTGPAAPPPRSSSSCPNPQAAAPMLEGMGAGSWGGAKGSPAWAGAASSTPSAAAASASASKSAPASLPQRGQVQGQGLGLGRRGAVEVASEEPVLLPSHDGYQWRQNGRKTIKDAKYPRTYYKCAVEGCEAKKNMQLLRREDDLNAGARSLQGQGGKPRKRRWVTAVSYESQHNHQLPNSLASTLGGRSQPGGCALPGVRDASGCSSGSLPLSPLEKALIALTETSGTGSEGQPGCSMACSPEQRQHGTGPLERTGPESKRMKPHGGGVVQEGSHLRPAQEQSEPVEVQLAALRRAEEEALVRLGRAAGRPGLGLPPLSLQRAALVLGQGVAQPRSFGYMPAGSSTAAELHAPVPVMQFPLPSPLRQPDGVQFLTGQLAPGRLSGLAIPGAVAEAGTGGGGVGELQTPGMEALLEASGRAYIDAAAISAMGSRPASLRCCTEGDATSLQDPQAPGLPLVVQGPRPTALPLASRPADTVLRPGEHCPQDRALQAGARVSATEPIAMGPLPMGMRLPLPLPPHAGGGTAVPLQYLCHEQSREGALQCVPELKGTDRCRDPGSARKLPAPPARTDDDMASGGDRHSPLGLLSLQGRSLDEGIRPAVLELVARAARHPQGIKWDSWAQGDADEQDGQGMRPKTALLANSSRGDSSSGPGNAPNRGSVFGLIPRSSGDNSSGCGERLHFAQREALLPGGVHGGKTCAEGQDTELQESTLIHDIHVLDTNTHATPGRQTEKPKETEVRLFGQNLKRAV